MWWWTVSIGLGGFILWLVLAVTVGRMTLRRGRGWLFAVGIVFPLIWIVGAFLPEKDTSAPMY